MYSIAHKVDLYRNIARMSKSMPEVYSFHPRTFLLPQQYQELKNFMESINNTNERTFIIKPDRGAQGKGIILIQEPECVANSFAEGNGAVAQQYIEPFLIDGLKFDLRIYVLVTSIEPLRVYIHREGMARFCTEAYEKPRPENLDHCFSHLTNYSLNKQNDHFIKNNTNNNRFRNLTEENQPIVSNNTNDEKSDSDDFQVNSKHLRSVKKSDQNNDKEPLNISEHETPFKRSLKSVMDSVRKSGKDTDQLQNEIDNIIRFTLASIQPFLSSSYHSAISVSDRKSRCFEILGFDVLIDHNMKPWLLEVNFMPSLTTDSEFDRILKHSVIKGALKIVDIKPDFKKILKARQKDISQGKKKVLLFDAEYESKIAKENTNWRQLLPLEMPSENLKCDSIEASEITELDADEKIKQKLFIKLKNNYERALIVSKESPIGAAAATSASKAKMKATQFEINERKKRLSIPQSVRNFTFTGKNQLPPLHDNSNNIPPKRQYILQQKTKLYNSKSDSLNLNTFNQSTDNLKLTSNIVLNQNKSLDSFISINKVPQRPLVVNQQSEETIFTVKMPSRSQRAPRRTEPKKIINYPINDRNGDQIDILEEEQRVNTLKQRLEDEKSLGMVEGVYDLLGLQKKKDPSLKYSINVKRVTKPSLKQVLGDKITI